jgi:hypothetical protein
MNKKLLLVECVVVSAATVIALTVSNMVMEARQTGISGKEMAGPISPEYNGRSDFAKIFQYDPNAPHFWLAEIKTEILKLLMIIAALSRAGKPRLPMAPRMARGGSVSRWTSLLRSSLRG